jgi:hypothetical protein
MMTMNEVRDAFAFAEGVVYVARGGWVSADDIPNQVLAVAYLHIIDLANELDQACRDFESSLYESREDDEDDESA